MQPARIRPSTAADLVAITAIYAHHVRTGTASFETDPPDAVEMLGRRAAVLAAGLPHLVAEHAGAVVGYASAGPYRARAAYADTVENSVYLHPDAQRRGTGRALLDAVIDACAVAGHRQMVAVVGDSANHASIALHRAAGFRLVGTLAGVGFKHGRWLDTVLLQRDLGPGAGSLPVARA